MKIFKQWWLTIVLLVLVAVLMACQLDYFRLGSAAPTATPARKPTLAATLTPSSSGSDGSNVPPSIPTTEQPATVAPAAVVATATDNLRVRASPSTGAAVLGRLNKGESAQVVGRTEASDWWQIAVPGNTSQLGWISADFTTTSGPTETVPVGGTQAPGAPTGPQQPIPPASSQPSGPAVPPQTYPYP